MEACESYKKSLKVHTRRGHHLHLPLTHITLFWYWMIKHSYELTLSERMPPYSRHHKYSKRIECRRIEAAKIKTIPDFCSNCKSKFPIFARIKTQKLPFS